MNKQSVETIQQSIFLLCLDKAIPEQGVLNRKTHVALQTIHGGGAKQNAGNRWYDKTIQVINIQLFLCFLNCLSYKYLVKMYVKFSLNPVSCRFYIR